MSLHKQNAIECLTELVEGLSPIESIKALEAIIKEAEICIECAQENLERQIP